MGSPAAAEGGGEASGGGRGQSGERSGVQARSDGAKSEINVERSCDPGGSAEDFAESVIEITVVGIVVIVIGPRTDIGMHVCDGDIRAYIGFLIVNVKAREGTTSRGTQRGAVIRCLTLRQQVVTMARRRMGRSRVNRTGNRWTPVFMLENSAGLPPPFLATLRFCVRYCIDRETVQKKKLRFARFFCWTVHNKLEND